MEPFKRILVPLDGSRLAEAVLPAAYDVASHCGATITLIHVLEHNAPDTVHGQTHLNEMEQADQYLRDVATRHQQRGVPTETHVHENPEHDVARSIAEHADELHVDLIAIATHGSSGLRGFLFGSIAQQSLRRTSVPILLVRPESNGERSGDFHRVLVPLDGTVQSQFALPVATMLATVADATLHLLRVVPTVGSIGGSSGAATFSPAATAALLDIEGQQAGEALAGLRAEIPFTLRVTQEVRRGDVVDELMEGVEAEDADLIVMSTHGRAGLEGLWTGSVASRLIGRLSRPIILVPIPDTGTPEGSGVTNA
ncbi:MAG: universal stress protein [Nitrolancea sp.]